MARQYSLSAPDFFSSPRFFGDDSNLLFGSNSTSAFGYGTLVGKLSFNMRAGGATH